MGKQRLLVHISELSNFLVRLVHEIDQVVPLSIRNRRIIIRSHGLVPSVVLPDEVVAHHQGEAEAKSEANHERHKGGVVCRRLLLKKELRPSNISRAVGDEDLVGGRTQSVFVLFFLYAKISCEIVESLRRRWLLTSALTVVFLVKPPTLPDIMDIMSGKLAA